MSSQPSSSTTYPDTKAVCFTPKMLAATTYFSNPSSIPLYFYIHFYFLSFFFDNSFDFCTVIWNIAFWIFFICLRCFPLGFRTVALNSLLQQCPAVNGLTPQLQLRKPRQSKRPSCPRVKLV